MRNDMDDAYRELEKFSNEHPVVYELMSVGTLVLLFIAVLGSLYAIFVATGSILTIMTQAN